MVAKLQDLICVYENVLDQDTCKFAINLFEENTSRHERKDFILGSKFTQLNVTEHLNDLSEATQFHKLIFSKVLEYKQIYYDKVGKKLFPLQNSFEQLRIKKYNNDNHDCFDYHVDVMDHQTAKRFLSFFWYLNDVFVGGETIFEDVTIKPETGKLVIFPPLWMFPHEGKHPISNEKYLLSTYLHYI